MPLIVIMGVAGSGKTTVGQMLAAALRCRFFDGDTAHSQANIEKMSRGIPLTDADRAGWLAAIHERMRDAFSRGESLVVACSALKQSYRTVLADGLPIFWVYLKASPGLVRARLHQRRDHFMKAEMADSQFEALEEPSRAIAIDASRPPADIVAGIVEVVRGTDRAHPATPGARP